MVDFDLGAALLTGFVGTVVMSALMTMASAAGVTNMPSMPLVTGSMLSGDRKRAMWVGTVVHYLVMGTVVFGIVYGLLFSAFDDDGWWVGALIGVAHGLLVGIVFMPMMPVLHPRMSTELNRRGDVGSAASTVERGTVAVDPRGQIQIGAPGPLGIDWGMMTPVGLVMGHAVYGLVVALVYDWIA